MTRLLNLFRRRRDRLERDLDRELRYHIDRRVEDLIKDGLGEPEARRRASIELGGVPQVQEAVRDTWIWRGLDALLCDVRAAMRSLARSWGFTVGAGAVLALTIGANIAIFSVVNTVLLQPLAYPDAERIVSVETFWTNTGRSSQDVSGADFLDWQAQNDVFEKMAVSYGSSDTALVVGDRAVFASDQYVSADFFAVFGQTASAGRLLTGQDVPSGDAEPTVVVVAYPWAVTHFGSVEAAIGKTITVYGSAMEIVGVAAPGFRYPGATDIWAPWLTTNGGTNRSNHNYQAVGRLKGGVDLTRAQAQMRTIGDTLARQYAENRVKTVSTAIFGLVPALQASRLDLSDALKQGGAKATVSRTSTRLRSVLVVAEVALSVILLAAAGLLLQSFQALQNVDLGFTTDRVLVAYTEYAVTEDQADLRTRSRFYADVLDRLRAVPGVSAAAGVAYFGMGREPRAPRDYDVQGRPEGQPGERPQAEFHAITPDYFKTLEIPVRGGRDFDRTDTPERPRVAIINETLARTAFPGESPIGQRLRTGTSSRAPWMEIVGVVGDTRWQHPSQPPSPVIYAASQQGAGNSLSILARTSLDETSLASTLRALMHDANRTVPVRFETMEELFDFALAYPRFRTQLIGLFAGVAALLAAVGLFSVLAYLVGQRTRELAVRRALGASAADVTRLIVGQGLRLVATGLVLGLAGALAVARLLTGLLYEISPWDVGTYLGTIAVLGSAALVATLLPAIRAATIAPLVVLQQE